MVQGIQEMHAKAKRLNKNYCIFDLLLLNFVLSQNIKHLTRYKILDRNNINPMACNFLWIMEIACTLFYIMQ